MRRAIDIAYRDVLHIIDEKSSLLATVFLISTGICRFAVVDENLKVKGFVSAYDVYGHLLRNSKKPLKDLLEHRVSSIEVECPTMHYTSSISEVLENMVDGGIGYVVLVDGEKTIKGIVTEGRIISYMEVTKYGVKLKDIMSTPLIKISVNDEVLEAISLMVSRRIKRLPVFIGRTVYSTLRCDEVAKILCDKRRMEEVFFLGKSMEEVFSDMSVLSVVSKKHCFIIDENSDVGSIIGFLKTGLVDNVLVSSEKGIEGIVTMRDVVVKMARILGVKEFTKHLII